MKKRIKDATYGELEGLDKANGLFNRAPNGKIVHGDLSVLKKSTIRFRHICIFIINRRERCRTIEEDRTGELTEECLSDQ